MTSRSARKKYELDHARHDLQEMRNLPGNPGGFDHPDKILALRKAEAADRIHSELSLSKARAGVHAGRREADMHIRNMKGLSGLPHELIHEFLGPPPAEMKKQPGPNATAAKKKAYITSKIDLDNLDPEHIANRRRVTARDKTPDRRRRQNIEDAYEEHHDISAQNLSPSSEARAHKRLHKPFNHRNFTAGEYWDGPEHERFNMAHENHDVGAGLRKKRKSCLN